MPVLTVDPFDRDHQPPAELADRFARWALAASRPVSRTIALDVACLALELARWHARPPHLWRFADIYPRLRSGIHNWYALERPGVPEPPDLPSALWTWFAFLAAEGLLHPGSDDLADLHAGVQCLFFGLDADGQFLLERTSGQAATA